MYSESDREVGAKNERGWVLSTSLLDPRRKIATRRSYVVGLQTADRGQGE